MAIVKPTRRPLPTPAITVRGHEPTCDDTFGCDAGCRYGRAWRTLRMDPRDDEEDRSCQS